MAEINVRKRNEKWEYRFESAKMEGKRKQISKGGFRTKKEALEAGTKALAEYNNAGLHFEPSEISVHDYLEYWFDNFCRMELKYNTQEGYLRIIKSQLQPHFGHYKLMSLNPSVIQQYAYELKVHGYSKSHITGIMSIFSTALDYAVEPLGYIKINPIKMVRMPKIERPPKERTILTMEEYNRICERFEGTRFILPIQIAFYTGLRISEVFALTWDDIDLQNCSLSVNKQTVKRNYGNDVRKVVENKGKKEKRSSWYFSTPKTKSSIRSVKFGYSLQKILKEEKVRQAENEIKYGEYYTIHVLKKEIDEKGMDIFRIVPVQKCLESSLPRTKLICVDEDGQYTSTDSFKYASRIIHNEMKLAFDFHSLRHTHATTLIENGANVKDVQLRLGHQNIETTLGVYVHGTEKMADQSVEILERVVHQ